VGDYENVPYLFAFKALERELPRDYVAYVLVTYLPVPCHIGEMKTKPTQQALRELGQEGIFPDFIICRSKQALDEERRKKIETFANISKEHIIAAPDLDTIYRMPLVLEEQEMGKKLLDHFKLEAKQEPLWQPWQQLVTTIVKPRSRIRIAIIGKYVNSGDYCIADSYVSIYQALVHAGAQEQVGVDISWVDASYFEQNAYELSQLNKFHGVIIPGGFGTSGVEGKVAAINYVREHSIPCLGLCYGMQLMVLEWARNVCKMHGANTTEIDPHTQYPIIDILPTQKIFMQKHAYGGTMRLGAYRASLKKESVVHSLYNQDVVSERHRHRYEVNPAYIDRLQESGLIFSGHHVRSDGTQLMEFVELPPTIHPFFVATQAHPEFKSRLGSPSPIFSGFVKSCYERFERMDARQSDTYATVSL
jgi:CTP synthase